jgi:hypothetical protein
MIGSVFGSLKAIGLTPDSTTKHKKYVVICQSCSRIFVAHGNNIRRHARSSAKGCNKCWHRDWVDGLSKLPGYSVLGGIIARCYNEKHQAYHNYGGRGITVCDKWKHDPLSFIVWLSENNWNESLEVDRRDNDNGYSPENCRVVLSIINKNNTRRSKYVFVNNEKITVAQASRILGIKYTTLLYRYHKEPHKGYYV